MASGPGFVRGGYGADVEYVATPNGLEQSEEGLEADFHHCTPKFGQEGVPELVSLEQNGREHSTHVDIFDGECRVLEMAMILVTCGIQLRYRVLDGSC